MAWTVTLDPPAVATGRFELDLNSGPIQIDQAGIDWGDAAVTTYEAEEQQWGSSVVSYRVPNRTVTIPLGLGMDDSGFEEVARAELSQKVARLQAEGGWLLRQRDGGPAMYADIVSATLGIPDKYGETGGLENGVNLVLECLPDFYGDLITLDTVNATGETQAVLLAGGTPARILGDYPGRAQIVVLDGSGNQQFGVLWGFRSRNYSAAASAGLVWPAAASLTVAPGAVVSALAGARGGQAISRSVAGSWTDVCYGSGSHVGSYQVTARVYCAGAGAQFRIGWAIGDRTHGLIYSDQVALPGPSGFYLLDLGQVRLDPASVGNQQWAYAVQAQQPSGATVAAIVDMVYLQPLDESSGQVEGSETLDPVMLSMGRLQMRWDSVMRAIAGGTVFTPVAQVFGDLPRIPPSGVEERPVQLLVKPSRGDLATYPDAGSQDAFSVSVSYRPSYLHRA